VSLFVVSDLHLGENLVASMFRDGDQGMRFADLCAHVARTPDSELVMVGDVFDLTAAIPPPRGLSTFGKEMGVPVDDKPARTLEQIMSSIRDHNRVALDALESLANDAKVTLVPGNHDRHLGEAGGRAALDAAGLSKVQVESTAVRRLAEKIVVLQHGHAWDPSNATANGGGEVMTAVLHHAVVPLLRHLAPRSNVSIDPDRIVALRPEERVVPVLERWLKPGTFEKFVDAFLELLVDNGYLSRAASWLATPGIIRSRLKEDDDLWERAGHTALQALEGSRAIPGKPPPPDIFVLGHTHVIDWAVHDGRPGVQRLYVNLGTWSARASDAAGPLDATMPVLRIDLQPKTLEAQLSDVSGKVRTLQRFEIAR
jgi:UDP-2,3-diacylglucosamine pyrophosphatase LpxH